MGVATCIGLSLSDFYELTPQEFYEVWGYCNRAKESEQWDAWNRMRYGACLMLQPHTKPNTKLTPEKLFPLPIDGHKKGTAPVISKEERKARLEQRLAQLKKES